MLRANVGLSRKVSRDYQSTGYTVNLDGEIPFSTDDSEGVLEKVRELFNLAQEALDREVDRDQGESAIGRRDEEPPAMPADGKPVSRDHGNGKASPVTTRTSSGSGARNGHSSNGHAAANDEPATNKQIQFILSMGKRFKLSTAQLESKLVKIVGRQCGIYELTKKEAGRVLDQLTNGQLASQPA